MIKPTTYKNVAGFRCLLNIESTTKDLYLVHCGQQQCSPGYTYNHKIPNEYHLHFVLNGKGTLEVKGHLYHIKKNDIFLIPKGTPIKYFADMEDPWEYMWITFDGEMAATYLKHIGLSADSPTIHSTAPTKSYLPLIQKILNTNELTLANEVKRIGYLYEIISALIEAKGTSDSSHSQYDYSSSTYVEYAVQYIKYNYAHIKVNDIANYIGINRSYLTTIFKKQLHVSPQEYLVNFRLKKAAELISTTNMAIQDISASIGYEDALTFSKMFKQTYGLSPRNYRNQDRLS